MASGGPWSTHVQKKSLRDPRVMSFGHPFWEPFWLIFGPGAAFLESVFLTLFWTGPGSTQVAKMVPKRLQNGAKNGGKK